MKFRHDLEVVYQFSLRVIKQTDTCTQNLKYSQFLYLRFCCVSQSWFLYALFTVNRQKTALPEGSLT